MLINVAPLFVGRIIMIMAMLKMAVMMIIVAPLFFGMIIMATMWKMLITVMRLKIQKLENVRTEILQ